MKEIYIRNQEQLLGMETVKVKKAAITDLLKIKEELDIVVESLELSQDKKFMKSYKKAKHQIKKREFDDWNKL